VTSRLTLAATAVAVPSHPPCEEAKNWTIRAPSSQRAGRNLEKRALILPILTTASGISKFKELAVILASPKME
jgi:hypothetical protein